LEALAMDDVGKFLAILSILGPFDIFCGHLEYFMIVWYIPPPFWYVV
jgi:hypothetical protein